MNNMLPIVISDSDTDDASETLKPGSDEISQFIPASLTSSQTIDLDHCLPSENEGHSSQNTFQKNSSRISKHQTPIRIVNIDDIIKGSPSSGLQEIIAHENAASENSTIVFSKANNNIFVIRKQNPASVSRTENPNRMNKLLPIPVVIKLMNVSGLLPKMVIRQPFDFTRSAKSVSESQQIVNNINHTNFINKNAPAKTGTPSYTIAKETKKTPTKKISYRCLDLRKKSYKIDYEGFTFFDRQGFFKAEEKRARRCFNILQLHIKVRQQVIDALEQEYENRRFRYEGHINVVVRQQANRVIKKKKTEAMKLAVCNKTVSKKKPKSKKKIVKPKLKKPNRISPTLTVKQNLKQKTNKKEKVLQTNIKTPAKSQRINRANLKKDKFMVSKLKVPLDHDKFRLSAKQRVSDDNNMPATFIDESNFEIIEQLDIHRNDGEIYFVNEHKVVTSLYMDEFPAFKNAVQLRKVKILDKVNQTVPTKTLNINKKRDDKHAAFCNFMTSFHASQKHSMFKSNVSSEHSYSTTTY